MDTQMHFAAFTGYRGFTRVLRCVFHEGQPQIPAACEPASDRIFNGANGLATTADRQTVFVNEPALRKVLVLRRTHSGFLEPTQVIGLPHMADNIEYHEDSG